MFELVVVWYDGTKDVYDYDKRADAERAELGMRVALGTQIQWSGVREKYGKRCTEKSGGEIR